MHEIDPAAEKAGNAADGHAEDQAHEDADEADGQRDLRPVNDPREDVPAEAVGTEDIHAVARLRVREAEELGLHRDEAEQIIGLRPARRRRPKAASSGRT